MTEAADPFGWLKDQGEDTSLLLHSLSQFEAAAPELVLGLAVSGGSDSMAMLHLMARVARHSGGRVEAVTVDHRLRPEAAGEAAFVSEVCASLGVPHQVLVWRHGAIRGNLMDQARRARYGLMAEWAEVRGIGVVALGHTADDQAECVLMGLARNAGLDGLSGMLDMWQAGRTFWTRPLLRRSRAELRAYLARHGLAWRDDPTNEDTDFTRTKVRKALALLSPLGITANGLATIAEKLQSSRDALAAYLALEVQRVTQEHGGAIEMDHGAFVALPIDMQRRLLIAAFRWLSGAEYPPREAGLSRVRSAIYLRNPATLSGCRILTDATCIRILREPKAATDVVPVGNLWDHRWLVEGPPGEVRALGPKGLPQVKDWRALGIPREVLLVTPAVWDGDTLLAAPVAGMENGWKARIVAPFHRFPVSD